MDIGRGLERIECRVTQYSNSDESVMPVEQVLERVSVDMPRAFNFFRNPADVSGNSTQYLGHLPSFIRMGKLSATRVV